MATSVKHTVTIANGEAVSSQIHFADKTHGVVDLLISASGWTTAELHVQFSDDRSTFVNMKTAAGAYVGIASFAAGTLFVLEDVPVGKALRFASENSSGVAVNQGAARTLTVYVRTKQNEVG